MLLELYKEVESPITKKKLINLVRKVFRILGKKDNYYLSVAVVSERTSCFLNQKWRKVNKPSSVLSFSGEVKSKFKFVLPKAKTKFLGEIIITDSEVKKRARIEKSSYQKQFKILFIHGLLHLLGFQHNSNHLRKVRERLENKIKSLVLLKCR